MRVEVFVAEEQCTVAIAGAGEGGPKGGGVAKMEQAGGGWSQAADVGGGHLSMIAANYFAAVRRSISAQLAL